MPPIRIGLASHNTTVPDDAIAKVAAALDIQVKRDLKPVWDIDAEVVMLPSGTPVPRGTWPIFVVDHTPSDFAGVHTISEAIRDHPGVPWAMVSTKRDWGLAASHECIEMLVDPSGNTTVPSRGVEIAGTEVRDTAEEFAYLLEVCDPIEDQDHAYDIDGVLVSDFYTPSYFDREFIAGRQYSFNGALTRPREVRPGGYLSWRHPTTGRLQQLRNFGRFEIVNLPEHGKDVPLRQFVDRVTQTPRLFP